MRILIPGGSGQVGTILARHLHPTHEVTVLSRNPKPAPWRTAPWDGRTLAPEWTTLLDNSDVVIHLSGKSVNCRYTPSNRKEIIDSRVIPTLLLGEAIARSSTPPALWMNASTSTFYRDARGLYRDPNDEFTGALAPNDDPNVPDTWNFSIDVARRWEDAFYSSNLPATRKIALRSSMTMSPYPGGVFQVLSGLVRAGLGGAQGPGDQYVSWIHDRDYCRAVDFLLERPEAAHPEISGPVNFTAPNPLLNVDFMRDLRRAWRVPIGLPAATWMLEIGAVFLRTETELILKSRRAIPTVLIRAGFTFDFPSWHAAAADLVARASAKSPS